MHEILRTTDNTDRLGFFNHEILENARNDNEISKIGISTCTDLRVVNIRVHP